MSFPKYVNSPIAHHDPIEDAKKYFDHVESIFYASEKAKKTQRVVKTWFGLFWFVVTFAISLNFDAIGSFLSTNWSDFKSLGDEIKEIIGLLILIALVLISLAAHRFITGRINRPYKKRVVSEEINAFCYIFLARKKLIEFSFSSNSEYLDEAENYFDLFNHNVFNVHMTEGNKELNVSLEEIDGYIKEYKWLRLDKDSRNILNSMIALQKIFPRAIERQLHLDELVTAIDWLVIYAHAISVSGRDSLSELETDAVLSPISASVDKMRDLIESSESKQGENWKTLLVNWLKGLSQRQGVWRFVFLFVPYLLVVGIITILLIAIFGSEHQVLIVAITTIAAGGAFALMRKTNNL